MLKSYEFDVCPVPKPRMTRRDKWLDPPRPAVSRYRAFADELSLKTNLAGFSLSGAFKVSFLIPLPKSASKRRKSDMDMTPHKQKPDIDNLVKALGDSLCPDDDSHIWLICASKIWTNGPGKIVIQNLE